MSILITQTNRVINMKYLAIGTNAKTVKGDGSDYVTAILYLAPADTVTGINLCPTAMLAGCKKACLYTAGRGAFSNVQAARIRKTIAFRDDPVAFVDQLKLDISSALRKAVKRGQRLAVRLNGTSDVAWENMPGSDGVTLMSAFKEIQFYDYTKLPGRNAPSNYHLTVSYSEANLAYASKVARTRHNIAVVFRGVTSIPATFLGRKVVDGDKNDLRFLDSPDVVVALYAKGPARRDRTGFVIDTQSIGAI